MNIEFEAQLLEKLGFTVEPNNLADPAVADDHGWVIYSPQWDLARDCESRADIATWLYSLGASNYEQYLAILRFREILGAVGRDTLEGLGSWLDGNPVQGPAEAVVDEVLRLSSREVTLTLVDWHRLAFEILEPHLQPDLLLLDGHMGMEFDAFMRRRGLDADSAESLISKLWRGIRYGVQRLGRRSTGASEQH